jgi:hypothetical protein
VIAHRRILPRKRKICIFKEKGGGWLVFVNVKVKVNEGYRLEVAVSGEPDAWARRPYLFRVEVSPGSEGGDGCLAKATLPRAWEMRGPTEDGLSLGLGKAESGKRKGVGSWSQVTGGGWVENFGFGISDLGFGIADLGVCAGGQRYVAPTGLDGFFKIPRASP